MKQARKTMTKFGSLALGVVFAGTMFGAAAIKANAAENADYLGKAYLTETESAEASLDKAKKFNETIAEEGFVLLKNDENALPLTTDLKVNLMGKNWVNPAYGGSGSSSFDANSGAGIDVLGAMREAGFKVNESLIDFYKDPDLSGQGRPNYSYGASDMVTGETPVANYDSTLKATLETYTGANIVLVSRVGGEGYEVSSFYGQTQGDDGSLRDPVIEGRKDAKNEHYLMLDDNEKDLIDLAANTGSKKVVLVINAAQPLELHDEQLEKIDAIVWVGLPGSTGFAALPRILLGTVNPSGRTVDTYAKEFWKIPAFQNFSLNQTASLREYDPQNSMWQSSGRLTAKGNAVVNEDGGLTDASVVTYEEGIYVGYRYFETRAFEEDKEATQKDKWYNDNVLYPFGYGLSYTTFEYTNVDFKTETITKDGTVDVDVTVKNSGTVAGKEVVQLYYSAPYITNEIEKSHVVLGDFAKTKVIEPGQTDTVSLKIRVKDMASYDFDDLNGNDYYTFELDAGDYTFIVGNNSHAWYSAKDTEKKTINLAAGIQYEADIDGEGDHNDNLFQDVSDGLQGEGIEVLSRVDFEGTMPEHPTAEDRTADAATITKLTTYGVYTQNDPTGANYDKDQPWYTDKMPTQATQKLTGNEAGIVKATDLIGKDYDDPLYEKFLDQLTVDQLAQFVNNGYFWTHGIPELNLPQSKNPDGPFGFVFQANGYSSNRCYYVSPSIVAATFNKDIARQQGESIGEEGIWMGYNGIYAPGANIHRTPFSGRNFEYYSEDATLSATMCREVVAGMQSKGVMPYIKHFALNDQEQDRNGVATYANEQTMREIYLRSFQWAVEDSKALGIMSSFNRVGATWAGASYALLTELLRKEWGFRGTVITDWANGGYMDLDQMVRAGNDVSLGNPRNTSSGTIPGGTGPEVTNNAQANTATHVTALRNAAHNVVYSVVNTCEMSKLTNYKDTVEVEASYQLVEGGLEIDFASAVYEKLGKDLGYEVSYEIVKPDSVAELRVDGAAVDLPPQIPAEAVTLKGSVVTIDSEKLAPGTYQLCVAVKLTKGDEVRYLGQSVSTTVKALSAMDVEQNAIIEELEGRVEALEGQIAELQSTIQGLNQTITQLTGRITALESAGGSGSGTDSSAEVAALKSTVDGLNKTVETLNTTVTALQSQLKAAQDKIAELEKKPGGTDYSKDIQELKDANTAMENANKALQDANKALQDKVNALESKVSELESKPAEGGCGSVIGIGSAIAASVTLLGAAAFVLKRKSK